MEALRNHVQHFDLPVHSLTLENRRDPEEDAQLEHSIKLYAVIDRLAENERFKQEVMLNRRRELANQNDFKGDFSKIVVSI